MGLVSLSNKSWMNFNKDFFMEVYSFLPPEHVRDRRVSRLFHQHLSDPDVKEYIIKEHLKKICTKEEISYLKELHFPSLNTYSILKDPIYFQMNNCCNATAKIDCTVLVIPQQSKIEFDVVSIEKLLPEINGAAYINMVDPFFIGQEKFLFTFSSKSAGITYLMQNENNKINKLESMTVEGIKTGLDFQLPQTQQLGKNIFAVHELSGKTVLLYSIDPTKNSIIKGAIATGKNNINSMCLVQEGLFATCDNELVTFHRYNEKLEIIYSSDFDISGFNKIHCINKNQLFCFNYVTRSASVYSITIKQNEKELDEKIEIDLMASFEADQFYYLPIENNILLGSKNGIFTPFKINLTDKKLEPFQNTTSKDLFPGEEGDPTRIGKNLFACPSTNAIQILKYDDENNNYKISDILTFGTKYLSFSPCLTWIGNNMCLYSDYNCIGFFRYNDEGKMTDHCEHKLTGYKSRIAYLGQGRITFAIDNEIYLVDIKGIAQKQEKYCLVM